MLPRVLDVIANGPLAVSHPGLFEPILRGLRESDRYLLCADFDRYAEAQQRAIETHRRPEAWNALSVRNVAGMGPFSSDRTVRQYAEEIWARGPSPSTPPDAGAARPPEPVLPAGRGPDRRLPP